MREDLNVSTKVSAVTDGDQEAGKPGPHEAGLQALLSSPSGVDMVGGGAGSGSSIYSRVSNPSASDKRSQGARPNQPTASTDGGTTTCQTHPSTFWVWTQPIPPTAWGGFITTSVIEGETPGRERSLSRSHSSQVTYGQHTTGVWVADPGPPCWEVVGKGGDYG